MTQDVEKIAAEKERAAVVIRGLDETRPPMRKVFLSAVFAGTAIGVFHQFEYGEHLQEQDNG